MMKIQKAIFDLREVCNRKWIKPVLLGILLGGLVTGNAYAGNLYRYTNSAGNIVLDDHIPPAYVGKGYEVLSKSGLLIEIVPAHADKPPVTTQEQKDADKNREREDKYILASYSSSEEIQDTSERKSKLLEREIRIVEGNLSDTRAQRDRERSRAANYQRGGKQVPERLKKVLLELDAEESKALSLLEERRQEHIGVKALYERYEARFVELTGAVGRDETALPEASSESEG